MYEKNFNLPPQNFQDFGVRWDMKPTEIEEESFLRIEKACPWYKDWPLEKWRVARRLIHSSADIHIADSLCFYNNPIEAGLEALQKKAQIYCDSNMIRSGLSLPRLQSVNASYTKDDIHCPIADPDIIEQAKKEGRTRALCSVEKARPLLEGSIVLIGNAPLALARIALYILEEDLKPALVVAMPVGFVNVVEAKSMMKHCPVPQIVLEGNRGGSALALTTLHAIIESF